jgi:UDP-N-acetylglucosamine 1-carboxyvinyltransferase
MSKFVILGGKSLSGTLSVSGAKNAVLPIMAATVMSDSPCILHNAPDLSDVAIMVRILEGLGAKVQRSGPGGSVLHIDPTTMNSHIVDEMLMRQVRSSIILMGAAPWQSGESASVVPRRMRYRLETYRPSHQRLEGFGSII